jgi:hypothetical protein
MTARRALLAVLFVVSAGVAACASTAKDPFVGAKSVDATVVERQYDPPGTGGASYAGTGNYYLVFEGKEGDATARYRFPVTRQQYVRFQEGAHVQLVILDGNLRDIRPLQ